MAYRKGNGLTPSLQEKLNAIRMVRAGQSKASVARALEVPESTFRDWCKNEDKIERQVNGRTAMTNSPEEPTYPAAGRRKREKPLNLSMKQRDMLSSSRSAGSQYSNQDESNDNKAELATLIVQLGLNQPQVPAYPSTARTSTKSVRMQQQAMLRPPPYPIDYNPEASKTISMETPCEQHDMERLKEYVADLNALKLNQIQGVQMLVQMMVHNNCSPVSTSSAFNISSAEAPQKIPSRSRSVLNEVQPAQGINIGAYPATSGLALKSESNSLNGQGMRKNLNKRSRSVLSVVHNLCPENKNLSIDTTPKQNAQEPFCVDEAIKNGEKFLDSLMHCSDPSISSSRVKPVIVLVKILREIFEKQNAAVLKPIKIKRK